MSEYIKKEDVIKAVYQIVEQLAHSSLEWDELKLWAKEQIEKIPSAEPEHEKGEWIYGEDENMVDGYRCSQCGFFEPWDYKYRSINFIQQFRFCPSCYAKMKNSVD